MHHDRIAWSRSGLLAYIDGKHKVYVTWLQCVDGEKWDYVPPVHVQAAGESIPVHLSWSTTNFDLAIADELGRINIVSVSNSGAPVNQIVASAVRDQRQRPAELDKLIGVHWLDSEKTFVVPRANQNGSGKPWEFITPLGPFHPVKMRSALVAVNGNGMLRLLVQTPDGQYAEVDALIPGAQYISHVSFAQTSSESLLIITADSDSTLMAYEAIVKWVPNNLESKQDFVDLTIHPIASFPLSAGMGPLKKLVSFRTIEGNAYSKNIIIRAVYPQKIVEYELKANEESLHPSFFELFSASDPIPPTPYRVWQLAQSKAVPLEHEIMDYFVSKLLIIAIYVNGEVESESIVTNMPLIQLDKVGLRFDPKELTGYSGEAMKRDTSVTICMSPTMCSAAVYYENTSSTRAPKLISMKAQSNTFDTASAERMALALATVYSCTVFNSEQCDDVLKVSWEIVHDPAISEYGTVVFDSLAAGSQRLLNVHLSAPEDTQEAERLLVIPSPSQKWLSFLIALGTSKNWERTPGCRAALSLLHLQLLSFGLTWTAKRVTQRSRAQNVEQLRLEIQAAQFHLSSMLGPMEWASDLMVRICQELYDISSGIDGSQALDQPNAYIALLMSSVARYLMRYFWRIVRSLSVTARNLSEQESRLNAKTAQLLQATKDANLAIELKTKLTSPSNYTATGTLKKLASQLQAAPVKFDAFEKVIHSLEDGMKALAAKTPLTEDQRKSIDAELIKTANIPTALSSLVGPLIEAARNTLFSTTDVPSLYFYDAAWTSLDGNDKNELIDGLRKRIILPHEPIQTCARCGMKSVVTSDQGKQAPQWLVLFKRHCICGGSWIRFSGS